MVIMFCFWATAATLFGVFVAPSYDEYIFIEGKLRFEAINFTPNWEITGEDSTGTPFHYTAKDVDLVLKKEKKELNIKYVNTYKYDIFKNDSLISRNSGQVICLKPKTLIQ